MTRNVSARDLPGGVSATRGRAEGLSDLLGSPFALPEAAAEAASRLRAQGPSIQEILRRGALLGNWPGLTRTLSLFVPGAGHFLRGDAKLGLFFLTAAAFLGTLAWALIETLDRLVGLLRVLGYPAEVAFWSLGLVYVLAAMLHLGSVLSSVDLAEASRGSYHPIVPTAASVAVPGWGQLLNGDRLRAGIFLLGLWIAGGVWLALSPDVTHLFNVHLPAVTTLEQAARQPGMIWIVQFTLPVLLWFMATYDAAISAHNRRR